MMKAKYLSLMFVAAAILGIGFLTGRQTSKKPVELTESVILEQVQQVAKLATAEHYISEVVKFDEASPWPAIFGKDKKALIIARGKVFAGFDMRQPVSCRIHSAGTNVIIEITLPEPRILAVEPTYEIYQFENLTTDQHEWLLGRAKRLMAAAAVKAGAFENAERSLALFLSGLFPTVNFSLTFGDKIYKGPSSIEEWAPVNQKE